MSEPSPKVILIIDDETTIQEVLKDCFTELGYKVYTASGIKQTVFAINKEEPDIIFLDIILPKVDGLDILKFLQKLKKEMIIVMMSGYATEEKAKFALEQGAFDYLNKPFNLDQVRNMLKLIDLSFLSLK